MQEYRVTVGAHSPGTIRFYKPGTYELHRLDGPAIEEPDGYKAWYQNGKLHRIDGPAIEEPDGHKAWFQNGEFHRTDGPAIEWSDGGKSWYQHNELHRLDGPAIERADGTTEYWIDGKGLTLEQFKKKTDPKPKEMTIAEIEAILGHTVKVVK